MIKSFEDIFYNSKLDFKASAGKLERHEVGELVYKSSNPRESLIATTRPTSVAEQSSSNGNNNNNVLQILKNVDFKPIPIDFNAYEMCFLPNGYLVSANIGSVTLFDEDFKLIQQIEIPLPVGCAWSRRNHIYVSDYNDHCVYKMDLNLNILKTVGTFGYEENQFKNPLCICLENERLYVCDHNNYRIKILNLDLESVDTIKLTCKPYSVRASERTLCVQGSTGTYFYDLYTKSLIKQYQSVYGRVSYVNSTYLVASYDQVKKVYCFDNKGQQIDVLNLSKKLSEFIAEWSDGCILCSKTQLIVSSHSEKMILKFDLK